MKLKTTIISLFLFSFSPIAFATVDFMLVNHITKEIYWGDEDSSPVFIGWEGVSDANHHLEDGLLKKGYSRTKNPYKIELGILMILGIGIVFGLWTNE